METYIVVFASIQLLSSVINFVGAVVVDEKEKKLKMAVMTVILLASSIWGYNVLGVFS